MWWATHKPHARTAVHRRSGTDEMREEKAKGAGRELLSGLGKIGDLQGRSAWTKYQKTQRTLPGAERMERARAWTAQARAWELQRAGLSLSTWGRKRGAPSRTLAPQICHRLWCDLLQAVSPLWGHFLPLGRQGSLPGEPWGRLPCLSGKQLRNARGTRPWAVSPEGRESHAGPREATRVKAGADGSEPQEILGIRTRHYQGHLAHRPSQEAQKGMHRGYTASLREPAQTARACSYLGGRAGGRVGALVLEGV